MADVKISALPAATTPLAGTEVLPIVQSSTTKKVAISDVTAGRAISASSLTLTTPLAVGSGGTGLTSLTAGYIPYGNGTSAFNNSANLTYSGTVLTAVGEIYASQAATNTQQIRLTPQSSGSNIIYSTYAGTNSYLPLVFNVGGSDRLTIATSGNVGIGTTTIGARLGVAGNAVFSGTAPYIAFASDQSGSTPGYFQYTNSTNLLDIFSTGAIAFETGGNVTPAMRLDASGNLGLGVTPSAWGSLYKAVGINTYADIASTNSGNIPLSLTQNAYNNGTNWVSKITSTSKRYEISDSGFVWYNGASATAGNPISFTQAMTLDASGRLGIGTPSPATLLDIRQTSATFRIGGDANDTGTIQFFNTTSSSINATISGNLEGGNAGGDIRFATKYVTGSLTEKMRIDGSGNVVINTAAIATNATDGFLYVPTCAGTPTGTPTTYTGRAPIVVNTTNNKLYFYSGGAWRDAGP